MAFRLGTGWERELIELSLNSIRNTLNYIRSTRSFGVVFQEAYEIQKSLLPKQDPVFDGYDISGRSMAAELVGGDLYDYHLFDSKMIGLAIGDASGHGLPAALLARDVLTGLRMGVERELKISSLIGEAEPRDQRELPLVALHLARVRRARARTERSCTSTRGTTPRSSSRRSEIAVAHRRRDDPRPGRRHRPSGAASRSSTWGTSWSSTPTGSWSARIRRESRSATERLIELVKRERQEKASTIIERALHDVYKYGANEKWRDDATAVIVKRLK